MERQKRRGALGSINCCWACKKDFGQDLAEICPLCRWSVCSSCSACSPNCYISEYARVPKYRSLLRDKWRSLSAPPTENADEWFDQEVAAIRETEENAAQKYRLYLQKPRLLYHYIFGYGVSQGVRFLGSTEKLYVRFVDDGHEERYNFPDVFFEKRIRLTSLAELKAEKEKRYKQQTG